MKTEMDLIDEGRLDFVVYVPDWLLGEAKKVCPRHFILVGKSTIVETKKQKTTKGKRNHG